MKRVRHLFVPSLTGCLLVASILSSCTSVYGQEAFLASADPRADTSDATQPFKIQTGVASWYGRGFHGRRTANGEIYNMYQATAAHLTAPLGTYARVTSLNTGRSIHVRINDRGPYIRGRILDLSYGAARQLDFVRAGSARVKVEFFDKAIRAISAPLSDESPSTMLPDEPSLGLHAAIEDDRLETLPILPNVGGQPFVVHTGASHEPNVVATAP